MIAAGACTIVAAQAGDANYNAASVTRSFQISGSYAVTGVASPVAGGSVSCTSPVNQGATTSCTVTPNTGYTLTNISGCSGTPGTTSPYTTGNITAACTVTATFTLNTYVVNGVASPVAGGSVSCASPVNYGSVTTCTMSTNAGYVLSGASGCAGSLSGNTYTTGAITAACSVTAAFVQLITYNLVLEGAQETPPNASTGTGSGTAVVDTVNNTITLNATFSGIGALSGAHLHGNAARGVSAGVKIGLTDLTSPIIETLTYLEADEAAILAGSWYLNLHTAAFGGGELRAQLDNLGAASKTLTVAVTGTGTGSVTGTGINCPGDCTETVAHNTVIVLTASPNATSTFGGWSGAGCSGTGTCSVTMNLLKSVTATFTALPTFTVTPSTGANGSITPNVPQTVVQGSTALFTVNPSPGYTASVTGTCGGSLSGNQFTTSTITADCTVVASFSAPIAFQSAVSRKTHGTAGDKNITLLDNEPIDGNVTTEPRAVQLGGHLIVFKFDATVVSHGAVTITANPPATVVPTSVTRSGSEIQVLLPAVDDGTRLSIFIDAINGGSPVSATVGILYGDITNSRRVSAADISAAKAGSGAITDNNFRADVNLNGAISGADVSVVKSRAGRVLP